MSRVLGRLIGFVGFLFDGFLAPFATDWMKRLRKWREDGGLVRPGLVVAAVLLALLAGGVATATRPPDMPGSTALPFDPRSVYLQTEPDPPARHVRAIKAPSRGGPLAGNDSAARVVAPYDHSAAWLSALLLTRGDVAAITGLDPIGQEQDRGYVLPVQVDPRPCGASSVDPQLAGDEPYVVWRLAGGRVEVVDHVASSATELVSPAGAYEFLGDVAAAGKACGYTVSEARIDGKVTVRLSWSEPGGNGRDLILVGEENVVLQVATSEHSREHAGHADLLARKLVANWNAAILTAQPSPSPSPSADAEVHEVQPSPAGGGSGPDPSPTGVPPNPPGCLPPLCHGRSSAR